MEDIDIAEYKKSLSELYEILKHLPIEARNKIPDEELKFYESNRDLNYQYIYDTSLSVNEQKLMDITIMLIANIYVNYWAENKEELQLRDKKILLQIEDDKRKLYNPDDLFKKNNNKVSKIDNNSKEIVVVEKKNIKNKIIIRIKKLICLT